MKKKMTCLVPFGPFFQEIKRQKKKFKEKEQDNHNHNQIPEMIMHWSLLWPLISLCASAATA